jgi:hypothetical protein
MSPPAGWDDEDVEGFDDFPDTHLDDDEYDEFLEREFDTEGNLRGEPRVAWAIGLAIVLLLALLLVLV